MTAIENSIEKFSDAINEIKIELATLNVKFEGFDSFNNKIDSIEVKYNKHELEITKIKGDMEIMNHKIPARIPWYTVASGVGSIISLLIGATVLFTYMENKSTTDSQVNTIQKRQESLVETTDRLESLLAEIESTKK